MIHNVAKYYKHRKKETKRKIATFERLKISNMEMVVVLGMKDYKIATNILRNIMEAMLCCNKVKFYNGFHEKYKKYKFYETDMLNYLKYDNILRRSSYETVLFMIKNGIYNHIWGYDKFIQDIYDYHLKRKWGTMDARYHELCREICEQSGSVEKIVKMNKYFREDQGRPARYIVKKIFELFDKKYELDCHLGITNVEYHFGKID